VLNKGREYHYWLCAVLPSQLRLLAMLLVHSLRKSFGARTAVDGVGFTIAAGEVYGLLGPNGTGKTPRFP
jgi:ABC-type transporter Mla maintaining outer membrane lipid asymmetry ATPase subunit MlaF